MLCPHLVHSLLSFLNPSEPSIDKTADNGASSCQDHAVSKGPNSADVPFVTATSLLMLPYALVWNEA